MLRTITGLSAIAAIASVALSWPGAIAQSAAKITTKQAALTGLPAAAEREEVVSKLIVKFRAPSSELAQSQMARSLSGAAGVGVKSIRSMGGDASLVALDSPMTLSEARAVAARLASNPAVEYAEPDVSMKPFAVPSEANYQAKQWNLFAPGTNYSGVIVATPPVPALSALPVGGANLPTAWDSGTGSNSVVIAVIDTGIVNHPDLNGSMVAGPYAFAQRFLRGYDFVSADPLPGLGAGFVENDGDPGRDADPTDPGDAVNQGDRANPLCNDNTPNNNPNVGAPNTWHGSHSAGIAAATANNTVGIAGIGWGVRVVPVRALGRCGGAMSDVADAIRWAAGLAVTTPPAPPANLNAAKVILVGAGGKSGVACSTTLQMAVDAAVTAGSVVIAAAGNEGTLNAISAPANCDKVIAVTAHSINGENARYANVSPQVAISAAGGGAPATAGGGGPIDDDRWDGYYIWSTTLDNATGLPNYDGRFGTSAAAAQVAGVAALILSKDPAATPAQVRGAITTSARPFPDNTSCPPGRPYAGQCGAGMLDATRALQATGRPVVTTPPRAVTVAAGATASFTVEAIGVASYQWTRAGANIAGATTASYTTPALSAADNNASFAVVMTNLFGSTTSPAAVVTVSSPASNSPSGGGALPYWQLLLLSALLFASRARVAYREQ